MAIDVEQHELVPKHELLGEDEAQEVLETYDVTKDKLPKIERNDSMVKHLSAEPGDMVKITRDSETAGKAVYYRVVKE